MKAAGETGHLADPSDAPAASNPPFKHVSRVAIVDDDLRVQVGLSAVLQDMGIDTESWPEGFTPMLLAEFDPDLILLDVQLDTTDAFAILRSRIPPSFRGVVSIVSAMGTDVVMDIMLLGERRGLRMGMPVLKPFSREDVSDLVEAADELLERRSIGQSALTAQNVGPIGPDVRLRRALDEHLLEVWYQPKFEVATGLIAGAEALIRARMPDDTIISPFTLFREASRDDMIEVTDHVLAHVIMDSETLAAVGFGHKLSVNIPVSYLVQGDPCRLVREARKDPRWPGLIFEITEDEALKDVLDVQMIATQCTLYSVVLSIDDFGAAYSSLSRLRDLPFKELKLDRSFVHQCSSDSTRRSICASVLALGAALGVNTVAEGVEDEADLRVLSDLGCDQVQGFLFARPMPLAELVRFIRDRRNHPAGHLGLAGSLPAPTAD